MKTFSVLVTETIRYQVEVEAKTAEEAEEKACEDIAENGDRHELATSYERSGEVDGVDYL